MPTGREERKAARQQNKAQREKEKAAAAALPPPRRAKKDFNVGPPPLPKMGFTPTPVDDEVPKHAEEDDTQPALVNAEMRQKFALREKPAMPPGIAQAMSSSGYKSAKVQLRQADMKAKERKQALDKANRERLAEGSVHLDENMLRKAFQVFDIDKNDFVGAKELKHLFAQIGEMPKDAEIDGMIHLCDGRGEGMVSFEDFINIFSNPAESLRSVDVAGLKEVVLGERKGSDDDDSEDEDESEEDGSSGSGSSLESR
mmetsp:Transcript_47648/g.101961  ORF Transcript_47648/g.101961 Transcript_47648/m.101961 type:complete len:257 (-) Transcript_47648:27-797(-)